MTEPAHYRDPSRLDIIRHADILGLKVKLTEKEEIVVNYRFRAEPFLSQSQVAKIIGVNPRYISYLEMSAIRKYKPLVAPQYPVLSQP